MSRYNHACPPEMCDNDDGEFIQQTARSSQSAASELQKQSTGIKIIPKLGVEAGLNKSDFDIQLDENAQQWFDQIHQYWRQCK